MSRSFSAFDAIDQPFHESLVFHRFLQTKLIFPTSQDSLLGLFSLFLLCLLAQDTTLTSYVLSSSSSRPTVLPWGPQAPCRGVSEPECEKNCIFLFTLLLLKVSNSFNSECKLAGPVTSSPRKIPGIFIPHNSCCGCLKICIHHYSATRAIIRTATGYHYLMS